MQDRAIVTVEGK